MAKKTAKKTPKPAPEHEPRQHEPRPYIIAEIAAEIGVAHSTVQRWAKRNNIGIIRGTTRLFTESERAELLAIIPGKVGNPNMGTEQPSTYTRRGKKTSE